MQQKRLHVLQGAAFGEHVNGMTLHGCWPASGMHVHVVHSALHVMREPQLSTLVTILWVS